MGCFESAGVKNREEEKEEEEDENSTIETLLKWVFAPFYLSQIGMRERPRLYY